MSEIQTLPTQDFQHSQFGKLSLIRINGQEWFKLKDVCSALDIKNAREISNRLDDDERGRFNLPHPQGLTWFVNESGLYSVILRSDKPNAKPFRKWVTSEVLPSIRKTGSYSIKAGNTPSFLFPLAVTLSYKDFLLETVAYNHKRLLMLIKDEDIGKITGVATAEIRSRIKSPGNGLIEGLDYITHNRSFLVSKRVVDKLGFKMGMMETIFLMGYKRAFERIGHTPSEDDVFMNFLKDKKMLIY